ncbi:MAG: hypothetical protein WKF79_00115 [Nocardioides sp.]
MANERHSYVEFYPSDWTAGTSYMPPLVEWLYLQVCLYNWDKAEAMPASQAAMRFSRSPSWQADLELLIEAGKVIKTTGGGLFVERAMVSANKAYDLWERKSRGGKNRHSTDDKGKSENGGRSAGRSPAKSGSESLASNQNQNQNQNQDSPSGESPPNPPAGDLVFTVPADALKAFRDHRTKIRAPMTRRAEELIIAKLERIQASHGHDPTAVIEQSVMNAWRGVFPIKQEDESGGSNRNGAGSGRDKRSGLARELDERMGNGRPVGPR